MIAHILQSAVDVTNAIAGDSNSIDWVTVVKWIGYLIGGFIGGLVAIKKYGGSLLKAILEKVTSVDNAVNHGRMERLEQGHIDLKDTQAKLAVSIDEICKTVTKLDVASDAMQLAREVDVHHQAKLEAKLDLLLDVHGVQLPASQS